MVNTYFQFFRVQPIIGIMEGHIFSFCKGESVIFCDIGAAVLFMR